MSEYAVTYNAARELVQFRVIKLRKRMEEPVMPKLEELKVPALLPCKVRDSNVPELTNPYNAVICIAKGCISLEVTSRDAEGQFHDALWNSKFYDLKRFIITPANIPHEFLTTRIFKIRIDFISHRNRTFTFVLNPLFEQKPISVSFASEELDQEFFELLDKSYIRLENEMFKGSYITEEDYLLLVENAEILLNNKNCYFLLNTRSKSKLPNWSSCEVEALIASYIIKSNVDEMRSRLKQNFLDSEGSPMDVYHKYRKMIKALKKAHEYQRKKPMTLARFFEKTQNPALKSE